MATPNISINPVLTSTALGTFGIDWNGGMQGTALADPAVRYQLAGGVLATSETLPMWGGVGIYEDIPTPNSSTLPVPSLGSSVGRATQIAQGAGQLTGFSVFDQDYASINSPQSPVPLLGTGQSVHFYRFNTNARVWLAMAPALVDLYGDIITTPVSWDFVNQQVIPYIATYAGESVTSATYTSSTGILSLTFGTAPFGAGIGAGADGVYISLSGLTTSAGNASNVNGDFPITSTASAGTVINVQAVAGLGTITINGSTGALAAGGGALPIRGILRVEVGNSMTVNYNASTNFATWNRSGSTLLSLL